MPRIQYRKPADKTYHDVVSAIKRIGSLESASQLTGTVRGVVQFGGFFEGVRTVGLRVSIIEAGNATCFIEAEAVSGTYNVPAPEVIDLLIKALHDPTYRYEPWFKAAGNVGWIFGCIVAFGVILLILLVILSMIFGYARW